MRGCPNSQPPKRARTGSITLAVPSEAAPEPLPVSEASVPQAPLPTIQTVLSTRVPTSGHIPKGARSAFGEVFAAVLTDFNTSQSEGAWARLLLLPKYVLRPCHGGCAYANALLHRILSRLDRWKTGDIASLWAEAVNPHSKPLALHNSTRKPNSF